MYKYKSFRELKQLMKVQILHQNYKRRSLTTVCTYSKNDSAYLNSTCTLYETNHLLWQNLNNNHLRKYNILKLGSYVLLNFTVIKKVTVLFSVEWGNVLKKG